MALVELHEIAVKLNIFGKLQMSKQISKDKLEEYQGFIKQLNDVFDDLSDGAYLATMESETRHWLKQNKIKANALDFYLEYSS